MLKNILLIGSNIHTSSSIVNNKLFESDKSYLELKNCLYFKPGRHNIYVSQGYFIVKICQNSSQHETDILNKPTKFLRYSQLYIKVLDQTESTI